MEKSVIPMKWTIKKKKKNSCCDIPNIEYIQDILYIRYVKYIIYLQ